MIFAKNILNKLVKNKWSNAIILPAFIVSFGAAVYLPGLSGPFLFDDRTNILENHYLKIESLDRESLVNAAFSVNSGLLRRPVSMLSFALNYYASGGSFTAFHFKITNLAIHLINGLLVFWLFGLIFSSILQKNYPSSVMPESWQLNATTSALIVSVLWLIHPIQLTSVLYVVQRMTSLSALFVLLGLVCYVTGRMAILNKRKYGIWVILIGTSTFGVLGILSKENAALLPLFILSIEIALFSRVRLLAYWDQLTVQKKYITTTVVIIISATLLLWATYYILPSYGNRPFSLSERLLTESRVLFYYLYLIVLPQLYEFGVFHDDIIISKNLISPLTTLLSIAGIITILTFAFICLRKLPLVSLGIFWFFTGHLIESTLLPLEIAHEHRNYLASIGPMLIILNLVAIAAHKTGRKLVFLIIPLFALLFSVNTSLRSWHWSDSFGLYSFEAENHPDSARAQAGLGSFYAKIGDFDKATILMRRASVLRPAEAADLININIIASWQDKKQSPALRNEIKSRLRTGRISHLTNQTLSYVGNCIASNCASLRDELVIWLSTLLSRSDINQKNTSFYYYGLANVRLLQGQTKTAISKLESAINANSAYLLPYIVLTDIYIKLGQLDKAKIILSRLQKISATSYHPRSQEIKRLNKRIQSLTARQKGE